MINNITKLPKIELRSALGAVIHSITFQYQHYVTGVTIDQQPIYGAEVEMADGTLVKHKRGYRISLSMQFTDRLLLAALPEADLVYRLSKTDLGAFCEYMRGWDDDGGIIRLYPSRESASYADCIIPSGGFTWTPSIGGDIPDTKSTDYSLSLVAKNLSQNKWC
jgi:hypothetical protein